MKKWKIYRLQVDDTDSGQRLDTFLAGAIHDLSRTAARRLIDIGGVHVRGRRMRSCSRAVMTGDQIEVYIDHQPLTPYRISPDEILFRDQYLIVLNKPAGIDTQPTHARYKGTVYEALQVLLYDRFRPRGTPELGMVQRLDRGTTGLMVFSIHPRAHKGLSKIFMEHQVEKRYLALVANIPDEPCGELKSQLVRSRQQNRMMSVKCGGKSAVTRYQVRQQSQSFALIELELLTGRSHQIRVHMAELGCPLLGDTLYGGPGVVTQKILHRPMLHASSLAFTHPVTGEALDFAAPLPEDMLSLGHSLGLLDDMGHPFIDKR